MHQTRIVVVGVQRMTVDLITQVYEATPGTRVERVFTHPLPLIPIAEEYRPDLLITEVGSGGTAELDGVLDRCPALVVYAVEAEGRQSFLYRLKPDKEKLGQLSPETLRRAAREVVPAAP